MHVESKFKKVAFLACLKSSTGEVPKGLFNTIVSEAMWQPAVCCVGVSLLCNVVTVLSLSGFVSLPGFSRVGHL